LESVKGERKEGRGRKGRKEINQRDGDDFMTGLGA